jgi:cytoskeletal protein CcmA (bactofilin family)
MKFKEVIVTAALIATFTLIFFFSLILSRTAIAAEIRQGEEIDLTGDYIDNLFARAGEIRAQLRSTDDVFLAGGVIHFGGETAENLWVAGGTLTFKNAKARYGVIAGGEISFTDAHFHELIVSGGKVRIQKAEIEDDLVAAGGEVRVDSASTIGGSTVIAGGSVTLAGHFSGDVQVYANHLIIDSSAVIGGNLSHTTQTIEIADGARIEGRTIEVSSEATGPGSRVLAFLSALLVSLGGLCVVPILSLVFPRLSDRGRDEIHLRRWETVGRGAVFALLTPVLWFFLFLSGIGIPLALILLPFLMVAGFLAWTVSLYTIGDGLRRLITQRDQTIQLSAKQRFGWTFLASLVVSVIFWIPVVGEIMAVIVFLAGLGALYLQGREHLNRIRLH